MGMKKKGRERGSEGEEAKEKISTKSLSVVMAAVLVSSALMVFMPVAAVSVTINNFAITPDDNTAGVTTTYTIQVNTTNFTSLNICIPAGFKAETPSAGDLVAEVDLWWDGPGPGTYYGYVNFTANATSPGLKVDVYADITSSGSVVTLRGMDVNYTEGVTTAILSPYGNNPERANLTLPTSEADGWLNITGLPDDITNVTISIDEFVTNPSAGDYVFVAVGVGDTEETVHIKAAPPVVPVPEFNILGLLALVGILSVVLAAVMKKGK